MRSPTPNRSSSIVVRLAAVALAAGLPSVAGASSLPEPEPQPIDGWRVASIYGADVRSLAIHPDDPELVLAGTSAGQVYRSDDGGESWRPAGPAAALAGWVVGELLFDPDRPGRLWAGLWGVWGGGSVLVSDDLGATWTPRSAGLPGQVYTLARVPGTADEEGGDELAGAGRLYAGTRRGVWGSADGGGSWRRLTAELPEVQKVTSLLVDPRHPGTVIAGTWRRAYRSDDGGATWRGVFEGMALDSEVFSLEPAPDREGEIWASTCGWVYRSADGGQSWKRFKEGLEWRRTPSFAVLPGGTLLAGTVGGLYASDDGGASWSRRGRDRLSVLALAYHPRRPRRVLVGTEGTGVWISDDGGATLRRSDIGMTNVRIGALAPVVGGVLAAVNHAGPGSGVHRVSAGDLVAETPEQPLPTVLSLAVDGRSVLAATEAGLWERSAGEWRRVGELGPGRVEDVRVAGGRALALTPTATWERAGAGARFFRLPSGAPERDGGSPPVATAEQRWNGLAGALVAEHPTGDDRRPAVLVTEAGAALAVRDGGPETGPNAPAGAVPLDLPFPPREITAALIAGDTLWIGSSGWGLWMARLGG